MFPNNPINQDHRIQSLNLRFNFDPQEHGELPVYVTCLGDNTQYFTRFAPNPHLTFNQIRVRLREGQFTILTKNQDTFKISIQQVQAEFISMPQLQINDLKYANHLNIGEIEQMLETQEIRIANKIKEEIQKLQINQLKQEIREMETKQTDFYRKFEIHSEDIYEMKEEIQNFQINLINQIKTAINECVQRQQQFRMIIQSQNDEVKDLKDSMQKYKLQIKKAVQQVKKINEESFKNQVRKWQDQIKSVQNQNIKIIEAMNKVEDKINKQDNKRNPNQTYFKKMIKQIQEDSEKKMKSIKKNFDLKESRNLQNQKQEIKKNLNYFSNQSEKKMNANQFQWSSQLKSKYIRINGNVVTLTRQSGYQQFCLLNSSFTNTLKQKQSWAIKIINRTAWIHLGVCLKSKTIEYNFNDINIKWKETGHGFYMIGSGCGCLSHSQKEFNYVDKSFRFYSGDVIRIEYDPIESKLRFSRNKDDDNFEFKIIAPPQNDAYHPCISLRGQYNSIELIQPLINQLKSY